MNRFLFSLFLSINLSVITLSAQQNIYDIDLSGNSYISSNNNGASIGEGGLQNWTSSDTEISTYLYFQKPQNIDLYIQGKSKNNSKVLVKFQDMKKEMHLPTGKFELFIGEFDVDDIGYHPIIIKGLSKQGEEFAKIKSFVIKTDCKPVYVDDFSHYWGRRGPSVHFKYEMPSQPVEWFYNEITVPEGNDVIGSYYMANGFGQGYFGIQCNSAEERRVLFSVWSPFETQDPKLIPDSLKIKLLRKGEGVHIGEFGNEGSGGQSYLRYNWTTGNKYKFLTQVKPDGEGNTIYTSYFFAADEDRWRLIASFLRPETDTYYSGAHSFLENFIPDQGYITRRVYFSNQWFRTIDGEWIESGKAKFTYDETARKKARLDYQGGYMSDNNSFYLQNCGFFNESTPYHSEFERQLKGEQPIINFDELKDL